MEIPSIYIVCIGQFVFQTLITLATPFGGSRYLFAWHNPEPQSELRRGAAAHPIPLSSHAP